MLITQVRAKAHAQPKEVKRFVKFATVGALGAVTDFTVLNLLIQLVNFPLALANIFSFSAAVAQNFMLNRRWTFPESQGRNAGSQLLQFVIVSLVGLGINTFLVVSVHHLLEPYWFHLIGREGMAYTVSYNFAKALAIGIVLFWNFLANRFWTYRGL